MYKLLVYIFFLHFVADFLLQSRDMGKRKSEVPFVLFTHLSIQFLVVFFGLIPFVGASHAIDFSLCNAAVHGVIDWNIWRLYKLSAGYRIKKAVGLDNPQANEEVAASLFAYRVANWKYWEDHLFYATIGLDQFLHMATLTLLAGVLL